MIKITTTKKEIMEILGVKKEEDCAKQIEYIAWWYLSALKEGYSIEAKRKCGPIKEEVLELPLIIESGD